MEVYILDGLLRREQVVDSFESMIWTERWSEIGDFEIRLPSTLASRSQFITGTLLAMNESYRVMTVETVEDSTDDEGTATLVVKGRSLEAVMQDRIAKNDMAPISSNADKFGYPGSPWSIAYGVFHRFLGEGAIGGGPLSTYDKLPFLQTGTFLPVPNIPLPSGQIVWEKEIGTVFDFIKSLCDTYELGFRLVRRFDTSELYFDVYTGNDLTSSQTLLKPVIFSPGLDNLQNTTELTTIAGSKNVAHVFNDVVTVTVYAEGVDPTISGFDRRVLVVKTGQAPEGMNVGLYLQQEGREALAKARATTSFDGEMNQRGSYKYGSDYNLGDKVEMRNADGVTTVRRVIEQIFVSDTEGERSYPTLSSANIAGTDTWLYKRDLTWSQVPDTDAQVWATQ